MSRLLSSPTPMSAAALKAVFSPESDSDLVTLITIYDPADNSVVARICDGFTQRITALDTESDKADLDVAQTELSEVYGVVSGGRNFIFLPLQITLPSEEEAQAPRCSIVINDVTRYLIPTIRNISAPPKVRIDLVLTTNPDVLQVSFTSFYINSFTYNANTVTAELSMINYDVEPFPVHNFTPKHFPGLF